MPDLLLEFFSEEIPARMQAKAADDLRKLVTDKLVAAGLPYEGAKAFATPRRLALAVQGVPVRQPDVKEERKGPRVGAPENAIAGFLKAAGLKSIGEAKVQPDKKGDFYVAMIERPGRAAIEVIAEIVPEVIQNFPWPKSMRWGSPHKAVRVTQDGHVRVTQSGDTRVVTSWLTWVRPLHSIIATFGPETEEPDIVKISVDGIDAGDTTFGHRFMAPDKIKVRRFDDYMKKLEQAKVVLDPARRAEIIHADAKNLAFAQGYDLVTDDGLLAEVAGLVEWPVVLMGEFDAAFLEIPGEVIRATIRNNQKCFVLRDPKTAKLVNKFILVANIEAADGGKAIVAGCERVIRARLADAKFFYETDLKTRLEDRLPKFEHIVFHEKLGTQAERIDRITALAKKIAPIVKADPQKAERAARLAKADLLTDVVGEFPELQGLMGKYYAEAQGEDKAVALACEEHYKPKGPDDQVPVDPVSVAVALADKIDTLVCFWAINEKPTGSKDPYALRRAALGVIRIIVENNIRMSFSEITENSYEFLVSRQVASLSEMLRNLTTELRKLELKDAKDEREALQKIVLAFEEKVPSARILLESKIGRLRPDIIVETKDYALVVEVKRGVERLGDFSAQAAKYWRAYEREKGLDTNPLVLTKLDASFAVAIAGLIKQRQAFEIDRLKVQLREQGARHDLVDAVFALEGQDDLLLIVRRVEALAAFLNTDDGKNLLAGYRRAANILRIEEKKDGKVYDGAPNEELFRLKEEKELAQAIKERRAVAEVAIKHEQYHGAMAAIAKLRPRVDAFFDKVTVNVTEGADAASVRANRLKLLNEIRAATRAVAEFSKIEG